MWKPAPAGLWLSSNEVHVWRTDLNLPPDSILALRELLSEDEKQRADRFHFDRDRQHFIAARGILRTILGRYSDAEPSQLQFSYSPRGKPALANPRTDKRLEFNLSHSHGLALYAIALDRAIGIDLEYIRPIDALQLAKRFFSDREFAVLFSFPPEEQDAAFFNYWTCKEAYLKATGKGIAGLEEIEISPITIQPMTLMKIVEPPDAGDRWCLKQLNPGDSYIAALVAEGRDCHLSCWQFPQIPAWPKAKAATSIPSTKNG